LTINSVLVVWIQARSQTCRLRCLTTNTRPSLFLNMDDNVQNITRLPTPSPLALVEPESYDAHRDQETPLIIDNGSTNLRFGFSASSEPRSGLNVIAKYKERKYNKPLLLFGEGIDAESGAKGQARNPWEGDVLLNFDALVSACSLPLAAC
jgi:actin-related protein 5